MNAPIDWLLAGEPYIRYRTLRDLLDQPEHDPAVQAARQAMLADRQVQELLTELAGWPGTVIASHKSAGQPFHKLTFAADLGLHAGDSQVDAIAAAILRHQSAEGPFQLPLQIDPSASGTTQEQWAWALCDAPLLVYALARFGFAA